MSEIWPAEELDTDFGQGTNCPTLEELRARKSRFIKQAMTTAPVAHGHDDTGRDPRFNRGGQEIKE